MKEVAVTTPEHLEVLATMGSILARLDELELHLPAIHLHNAVEALRLHICEASDCIDFNAAHMIAAGQPGQMPN